MAQNYLLENTPVLPGVQKPESSAERARLRLREFSKRTMDICGALLGLFLLGFLFPWIALSIRRDSPGPLFYRGPRLGRHGKLFYILKFRTMYERPESYQGPPITAKGDTRITPFGKFLRDTKLNELPQFWNVLKGEMSLVGPRPEDPQVVEAEWGAELRAELLSIRPGITSPATVLYNDEESLLNAGRVMETYLVDILPSKQRLDQLYVRHNSFSGDLDVIFWTLLVLVPRLGRYRPPERQLFLGLFNSLVHRFFNWFVIDLIVALAAIGLAGLLWRSLGPLNVGWMAAVLLAVGFALLFSLLGLLFGTNRVAWSRAPASDVLELLLAGALAAAAGLLINALLPVRHLWPATRQVILQDQPMLPEGLLLTASALALAGFVTLRYRQRLANGLATRWLAMHDKAGAGRERVLVVGGGETGQFAAWMLTSKHHAPAYRVVGFIDDDMFKQGIRIHGLNVIGQRTDIARLVEKYDIGLVIFAIHNISGEERKRLLEICTATPARVVAMPDIPGALNRMMMGEKDRAGTTRKRQPSPTATPDALPCALCLTRVTPLRVDGWLAELEEIARSGDLDQVQAQLHGLRKAIREDAVIELSANLPVDNSVAKLQNSPQEKSFTGSATKP